MNHIIARTALIAAALLLPASPAIAAETKPATPADGKTSGSTATPEKATKAKAAAPRTKPVDINSAGKPELMKLKGIGEGEADRIIAGRPYLSKAHLVTRKIIPHGVYVEISDKIIAIQKPEYLKQASQPAAKK